MEKTDMKLWVDDLREAPEGYVHIKSVNEAKEFIMQHSDIEMLDLDHDLGDFAKDGGDAIELLKWLIETGRTYPVKLHTMNPVGRQNMQALIDRYW